MGYKFILMAYFSLVIFAALFFQSCTIKSDSNLFFKVTEDKDTIFSKEVIDTSGINIESRFRTPKGYERTVESANSFAVYLRNLPLKPHGSAVTLFDGRQKVNYDVYDAVIDLEIGSKDLHQCADAVMRLRAEYLWSQKRYDEIHFNLTNGFRVDYSEWMKGKRIVVNGNKTTWSQSTSASNAYKDFWKYMELVFTYAGTLSLSSELKRVKPEDLKIGDVFIRGGSPGHAVIVVDMAINPETRKKLFLIAQSYMPAQEIQLLKNPNDEELSPWYSADFGDALHTPEWSFVKEELKGF